MNIILIIGIALILLSIIGVWYTIIREQKEHRQMNKANNWILFLLAAGLIITTLSLGNMNHKL